MDKVVESMENKFIKNNQIYKDLACLSPIHFEDFKNGLPPNSLSALAIKLKTLNNKTIKILHWIVYSQSYYILPPVGIS